MPCVDYPKKEGLNYIVKKRATMESESNGSGESNTEPFFFIDKTIVECSEREPSGLDENTQTKIKSAIATEDSIPILHLSPQRSENIFGDDDDETTCISPSPEAIPNFKTNLIPSTPNRQSPSSSGNSNGNAGGNNSPNHSKTSFNRQSAISKRISFSQDSGSQAETPVATKNQISEFIKRNLENTEKDLGNSLKRPMTMIKDSGSESSSDVESIKFPKRRKDTLTEEELSLKIPRSPVRARSRSRSLSPPLLIEEKNNKTNEPENQSQDEDDIHLYLSATLGESIGETLKDQNQIEIETNQDRNKIDSEINQDQNKIDSEINEENNQEANKVIVIEETSDESQQLLFQPQLTQLTMDNDDNFKLNLEDGKDLVGTLNPSPDASVQQINSTTTPIMEEETDKKEKANTDSQAEKSFHLECTFVESDNSAILTEDSNVSGGLKSSSFKIHEKSKRLRNRNLVDTRENLGQSPIGSCQKRAHSSDETEPKKNLKTGGDTSLQSPEFDSSQETLLNTKIRVKIVKQHYRDYLDANEVVVKSKLINEEVISDNYLDRSSSSLSYHSSLASGELADQSCSQLSKSTSSSVEPLNISGGKLDGNKETATLSTLSLDRSPPSTSVSITLPLSAKEVKNRYTSSSEELVFKTPKSAAVKKKPATTPKRKVKGKEYLEYMTYLPEENYQNASISSPEIPLLKTPKKQQQQVEEANVENINIPEDPNAIYPGVRVLAKWGDGYYYPGKVGNQKSNETWEVTFDDGQVRNVKLSHLFNASMIKAGQSVLAQPVYEDNFKPGVIREYYRDKNEDGYVVDLDSGVSCRCKRENVILSGDQAASIINPTSPYISNTFLGPDLNLDNIVDGKRRRTPTMAKPSSNLVKSRRDPLLDSTESEISTSTSTDSDAKSVEKSTKGLKKLTPIKNSPKTKTPKIPQRGRGKKSPKTPKISLDEVHENQGISPKASGSKVSSRELASVSSPELEQQKSGNKSNVATAKRAQKIKRTLENEFDSVVLSNIPEEKSTLFRGLSFLISCADRISDRQYDSSSSFDASSPNSILTPFNKDYMMKLLELGGGQVLQTYEDIQTVSNKKIILISNTHLRTLKYIKCLASGIPCVYFKWVLDCILMKKRLSHDTYILPAGYSITEKEIIPWHGCKTILKGLHILLISKNNPMFLATWKPVLLAAQAETVHRMTNDKSPHNSLVNVIVSDQSCPGHIIRRAKDQSIPIVSSEWVIQCLINGEKLPFDAHKKFDYMFDEN